MVSVKEVDAAQYAPTGIHKTLWDYWCELANSTGKLVPSHADFRPSHLASILPTLALSEYVDENTQLIKVIGGGHDNLWPSEAAGANLFDFVEPETAKARKLIYKEVMARPCGCYSDDVAVTTSGRRIRYRGLFLPLLNKVGEPKIFLGTYEATPEGFSLEDASEEGIVSRVQHELLLINLKEPAFA